jgi:hypothetical protein
LILLLALSLLSPIGCGGDGDSSSTARPERLSATGEAKLNEARLDIRSYCRRIRLYLGGRESPPTTAQTRRAYRAVDSLVSVAGESPEAQYQGGGSVRQLLGDTAEDLEGTNCSRDLVARLERGLASLPSS